MKRILVTGGFGFLGAAIANRLFAEGHSVTVLDDGSRGDRRRLVDAEKRFIVQTADVRRVRFGAAFDSVWHLAAVNGTVNFYKAPYRVLDVQLGGTLRAIQECRARDVPELVLFSSSEVYHQAPEVPTDEGAPLVVPDVLNPRYSYAGSKIASELLALHSGLERVLVLRPHNVYGPDMGYDHVLPQFMMRMLALSQKRPLDFRFEVRGAPKHTRSFVHVSDFVDGAMAAWEKGERRGIYHVGTEDEVSMAKLARLVSDTVGFGGDLLEVVEAAGVEGGPSRRCPDTRKLRALGWEPKVELRDGVNEFYRWMIEHREEWPKEAT